MDTISVTALSKNRKLTDKMMHSHIGMIVPCLYWFINKYCMNHVEDNIMLVV